MAIRRLFFVLLFLELYVPTILLGQGAQSTDPPLPTEIERVGAIHNAIASITSDLNDDLWPGFRPAETPVLYTGLSQSILMNWSGKLPEGFQSIDGLDNGAWSSQPNYPILISAGTTLTSLDPSYSLPTATALAVHEHFHAYQRRAAKEGATFAKSESPAGVRHYPAFDTLNSVLIALEGRLLYEVLVGEQAGSHAEEFLMVRSHRHARLPKKVGRWERLTERHEGLADYVGIRALKWLEEEDYSGWGAIARQDLNRELTRLTDLIELAEWSLRYRFYTLGSAQALVLDQLSPGWKDQFITGNWTLDDLLASILSIQQADSDDNFFSVIETVEFAELQSEVSTFLSSFAERREALMDSVLSASGLRIQVEVSEEAEICSLDPLNVRHIPGNRIVHPAFVTVCTPGEIFSVQFSVPTVEDLIASTFTAIISSADEIEFLADGELLTLSQLVHGRRVKELKLNGPGISLEAGLTWARWAEGTLLIRLGASTPEQR